MKCKLISLALSLILITGCSSLVLGPPGNQAGNGGTVAGSARRTGSVSSRTEPTRPESGGSRSQASPIRSTSHGPEGSLGSEIIGSQDLPDAEFTLVVSGDVLSHDNNWQAALQADGSFDYLHQFERIEYLLSAGDLTLVNLETPVSGEGYGYRGFPRFNAPVALAKSLKAVGVDLVITANNHILDNGVDGLKATLDNLDEVGLLHTGAARSRAEAAAPMVLTINGIRIGFAASTTKLNMNVPEVHLVPLNRDALMRQKIQALRDAGAELIVYHIHWGREYTEYPSRVQMDLYRILAEEGVDIVIGSHPHRLQPAEIRTIDYEGAAKDQAVIWSTANLLWGEPINRSYVDTGAVFRIKVARTEGKIRIKALDYDLTYNLLEKIEHGVWHTTIIAEADKETYRKEHPSQYARIIEEFRWAHGILNSSVDVLDQPVQ